MGIKERQERGRETMRRSILDAARELFVHEGYHNVSIRKIAERIEYSPAAIYGYFPSKDDIFFALAEEGFRLLGDQGESERKARLDALPPLERVQAMFWRLYEFSREQPQYFALMFVDRSVPRISREYERFALAREMKQDTLDTIQDCIASGALPPELDARTVLRTLSAGLIGVAVMHLSERLGPGEDPDRIAANVLDATMAGLRCGVALRPIASQACYVEASSASPSGVFSPGVLSPNRES
jgi:AcrR family transcriptional regulator